MIKKTKRIRPSLASYRELERLLEMAENQIDSCTSKLVEMRNESVALKSENNSLADSRMEWITTNSKLRDDLNTQEAITKDLMARRSANLLEIANLKKTSEMGFLLAIVVIIASSYQIYNAFQSL
jgi:vacuolar-type H+-ATPase subunit I/STV1